MAIAIHEINAKTDTARAASVKLPAYLAAHAGVAVIWAHADNTDASVGWQGLFCRAVLRAIVTCLRFGSNHIIKIVYTISRFFSIVNYTKKKIVFSSFFVPNHDNFKQTPSFLPRHPHFPYFWGQIIATSLVKISNFSDGESAKATNLQPVFKKVFSNAEKCVKINQ